MKRTGIKSKPQAKPKRPTCPICKNKYIREREGQQVCENIDCAVEYNKQKELDAVMAVYRPKPKRKTPDQIAAQKKKKSWYMKRAVRVYNRWIVKVRDANQPCISSGRTTAVQWQCGHYIPATNSALRFDEDNTHKQSSEDNLYRSGNLTEYRINLIKKIGIERVERLEGPHDQIKYTIEELERIFSDYSQRLRDAGF